jgi:hypothetical protein
MRRRRALRKLFDVFDQLDRVLIGPASGGLLEFLTLLKDDPEYIAEIFVTPRVPFLAHGRARDIGVDGAA